MSTATLERVGTAVKIADTESDSAWKDTVESTFWLAGVGALSLMLASGSAVSSLGDALTLIGRAAGIVAGTMMMVQLLVIARVPAIEKRLGHDRAARLHGQLGRMGFIVMGLHVIALVLGYAARLNSGWWDQAWSFLLNYGTEMTLAVVSFWLLIAIVITSLAAVRRAWKYESWHWVHLLTYAVIGLAIPHQFVLGTTFSGAASAATDTVARWYWAVLWTASVGAFVAYRLIAPVVFSLAHRVTVERVDRNLDGTISVWMMGRNIDKLGVRAGHFFEWRFLAPGMWTQAHPFSLSRSPRGNLLRITVKPVGDFTSAMAGLKPGTRVMIEGPLGRLTGAHRTQPGTVLVGAGSGIAPMVALLDELDGSDPIVVVLRASSPEQIPHLEEIRSMCSAKGATLYLLTGRRGHGWMPVGLFARMSQLAPSLATSDVFVCGPEDWASTVIADARACGAAAESIHREEFTW